MQSEGYGVGDGVGGSVGCVTARMQSLDPSGGGRGLVCAESQLLSRKQKVGAKQIILKSYNGSSAHCIVLIYIHICRQFNICENQTVYRYDNLALGKNSHILSYVAKCSVPQVSVPFEHMGK